MMLLRQKLEQGEVTAEWAEERARIMSETQADDVRDRLLHLTSDYTLLGPLRFYLYRQVRERSEALGLPVEVHEARIAGGEGPPAALEASPI
jgi:cellobiose-specific phosphotransferase system component IIB